MSNKIPRVTLEQWAVLQAVVDEGSFAQAAEALNKSQSSIDIVKQGLGFAWIPREQIQDELESGQLTPLPLVKGGTRRIELYLVYADRDNAGLATQALARTLHATCNAACARVRRLQAQDSSSP